MLGAADYDARYRTLDLDPGATAAQIEENWRLLAAAWHPDKFAAALKDKATRRLQEVNRARDELTGYWRRYGEAPPSVAGMRRAAAAAPRTASREPPPRPAATHRFRVVVPARWRVPILRAVKWVIVFAIGWSLWRPIRWEGGVTVIELFFWLMLIAGSAQLVERLARACFGGAPRRHRSTAF